MGYISACLWNFKKENKQTKNRKLLTIILETVVDESRPGSCGVCWGEPPDLNINREDSALSLPIEYGRPGTKGHLKTVSWVHN